jgi:rhodanese-related sulfurtransferase
MSEIDTNKQELEPKEAAAYLKAHPTTQLVDVRQPDEFASGHLAKAKLIPLGTLPVRLSELDRSKPLLFYCAAGGRSGRALDFALDQGYEKAMHVVGGIGAWAEAGLPVEV